MRALSRFHQNSSSNEENFFSLIPYYAVFVFLIPALMGLVGANVQGRSKPLTSTHAANLWSCVLATVLFCFAFAADAFSRRRRGADSSQFFGLVAIVSGSLSTVSLISIFLPRLIGYIILSLAWILCTTFIVVYKYGGLLKDAFDGLYEQNLEQFSSNILNWFQVRNNNNNTNNSNNNNNNNNMAEQQIPPV